MTLLELAGCIVSLAVVGVIVWRAARRHRADPPDSAYSIRSSRRRRGLKAANRG